MKSSNSFLKEKVIALRRSGKTYGEIQSILGKYLPKSTLSYWCRDIPISKDHRKRIKKLILANIQKGRAIALVTNKIRRIKYLQLIEKENKHLASVLENNKDIAKIALAMLYLGEGTKKTAGSLVFSNSNPAIISLFIRLLKQCYVIDGMKFRCTLQCRADQNIKKLEKFWSNVTSVHISQFYKARIDPRTVGKSSKKKDYKGVCRIDYFSARIYTELLCIGKILTTGL